MNRIPLHCIDCGQLLQAKEEEEDGEYPPHPA